MEFGLQRHSLLLLWVLLFLYLLLFISKSEAFNHRLRGKNNSISAVLSFGDSTLDSGNNNYISTAFRCNFPPYGRDLPNHRPTGRFTNGRLATDFIASYFEIKDYVPPYLDPNLSIMELMTGVSFASGGSGFDPLTATLASVIGVEQQLEYLKEYKKRLQSAIGKQRTEQHMNKAMFLVSAGTNDLVITYYGVAARMGSFTISAYQKFLVEHVKRFVQGLVDQGGRRIAIVGLPPIGCLPIVITLYSDDAISHRACIDRLSSIAKAYNALLQKELTSLQRRLSSNTHARIYYLDIYKPLEDMIKGRGKFGFEKVASGCCGTGYLEASFLCNPNYVCPNASKYVFWDAIHPTEETYYNIVKAALGTIDLLLKDPT